MKREDRVDQHGFPIPPGFDDPPAERPQRARPARKGRWIIVALLVAVIASLVIESPISTTGRRWIAGWLIMRAQDNLEQGDVSGAIWDIDWAIRCVPDIPKLYELRGQWRLETKDLQGSLDDFSRAVELNPADTQAYLSRSVVYQRMDRPADAIADLNQAVKRSAGTDPFLLNARAYARALAGVELKEGLADIDKALELIGKQKENSYFVDTRGWLRFRMGDYKAALTDLNKAIELGKKDRDDELDQLAGNLRPRRVVEERALHWQHNLAVMYHHRGEIYQKLGEATKAAADLERADKLGYNPAEGVF